jgi:hypothetical protein
MSLQEILTESDPTWDNEHLPEKTFIIYLFSTFNYVKHLNRKFDK